MSQRTWNTERYGILTGWDRPHQCFFLVIEDHGAPDDQDELVYSNLSDPDGPDLSIPAIASILHRFSIEPPHTLWDDLREDQRRDRGYFTVWYDIPLKESRHA